MTRLSRADYAALYGPTTGDRIRLADTDLLIEVERDLTIPGEENAHKAGYIASEAKAAGFDARPFRALGQAIDEAATVAGARVVICGSLYLGGYVLDKNGTPPD